MTRGMCVREGPKIHNNKTHIHVFCAHIFVAVVDLNSLKSMLRFFLLISSLMQLMQVLKKSVI